MTKKERAALREKIRTTAQPVIFNMLLNALDEKDALIADGLLATIDAQRRTIATLRARLEHRHRATRSIWESYFEWPLCMWANIHAARIAAIRNFGALP